MAGDNLDRFSIHNKDVTSGEDDANIADIATAIRFITAAT